MLYNSVSWRKILKLVSHRMLPDFASSGVFFDSILGDTISSFYQETRMYVFPWLILSFLLQVAC